MARTSSAKSDSRIDNRLGNRTQARAGALYVPGDHQKIGRIARQAVNDRGDHNIAGRKGRHRLLKRRPVGGRAEWRICFVASKGASGQKVVRFK
jgi:hypothetical protein